jgi:hypothetical protein
MPSLSRREKVIQVMPSSTAAVNNQGLNWVSLLVAQRSINSIFAARAHDPWTLGTGFGIMESYAESDGTNQVGPLQGPGQPRSNLIITQSLTAA